jgi:hypothetical protein
MFGYVLLRCPESTVTMRVSGFFECAKKDEKIYQKKNQRFILTYIFVIQYPGNKTVNLLNLITYDFCLSNGYRYT